MRNRGLIRSLSHRVIARGARRKTALLIVVPLIAVLMATTGPGLPTAMAQGNGPEPVKVQVEDVTESTAADFERGQARGITVAGDNEQARLQGQGGEFISGGIALPFAATHLGLHWIIRGGSPESVQVAVRTSQNGQTWSDWYPLPVEAIAELTDGHEVFAALAPGGRARLAQYRVIFGSAEVVTLDAMTVTALNSASAARKPSPPPPPPEPVTLTANGESLSLITREGWGCDEKLRFTTAKRISTEKWPEMYVPVKKIVIHHTATSNEYSDGAAEVRAIYTYHVRTLGWGDIGYNMLVDQYGKVYEGRHGRGESAYPAREVLSDDVVAGHAYAYNYGTTGIAAIGNASTAAPSGELLDALENAVTFESARQFIDPEGTSDFLRSDGVWHGAALNNISGHRDVNATECPGTFLTAWLGTLRANVANRLERLGPAPSVAVTVAGKAATFNTSGATSWSLEGWYKAPGEEPITYLEGFVTDPVYFAGDTRAWMQSWSTAEWPASEEKVFESLPPGHYTMHVHNGGFAGNVTFLVTP